MSNPETKELMWRRDINNQKNRKCTIEKLKEKEEYNFLLTVSNIQNYICYTSFSIHGVPSN
jgi:hypothetical protein